MLVSCLLLGACSVSDNDGAALGHAWLKEPVGFEEKTVILPPFLVYRVAEPALAETVELLASEPYIQISPSMAVHYTGQEVRVPAEMRPFLIRGLAAGGELEVVQAAAGLWVRITGAEPASIKQQPLVVLIDPTPGDIFVTVEPASK